VANEQLYDFIYKQLNPLDPRTRLSSARPDFLIDDPLAAYRKTLGATLSTNIFEGVQNYYGIVLLNFKVDKSQTFYWKILNNTFGSLLPWFNSADDNEPTKTFCICMVPELHAHLGVPFDQGYDTPEYVKRSLRFPIFMDNRPLDGGDSPSDLAPGNIVNIVFSDTNLSKGAVTGTLIGSSIDATNGSASSTGAHADGDSKTLGATGGGAWDPSPRGDCKDVDRDAHGRATADGIMQAYGDDELMTDELANKIVEVAHHLGMDPAWLANVMYFESGAGVKYPAFSPSTINPHGGAAGLIQFTDRTAGDLGTNLAYLRSLKAVEQMDYVQDYFELDRVGGTGGSKIGAEGKTGLDSFTCQEDVFMGVFYSPARGKGPNYNIYEDVKRRYPPDVAAKYLSDNNGIQLARDYAQSANKLAKICKPK
jgi:hypothetical protein